MTRKYFADSRLIFFPLATHSRRGLRGGRDWTRDRDARRDARARVARAQAVAARLRVAVAGANVRGVAVGVAEAVAVVAARAVRTLLLCSAERSGWT